MHVVELFWMRKITDSQFWPYVAANSTKGAPRVDNVQSIVADRKLTRKQAQRLADGSSVLRHHRVIQAIVSQTIVAKNAGVAQ